MYHIVNHPRLIFIISFILLMALGSCGPLPCRKSTHWMITIEMTLMLSRGLLTLLGLLIGFTFSMAHQPV